MQTRSVPPANLAAGAKLGSTSKVEALPARGLVTSDTQRLFPSSKRQLRINLYMLLMFVDVLCIFACFAFGALVRFGDLQVGLHGKVSPRQVYCVLPLRHGYP